MIIVLSDRLFQYVMSSALLMAYDLSPARLKPRIRSVLIGLLLPRPKPLTPIVSKACVVTIVLVLAALLALAYPPVIERVTKSILSEPTRTQLAANAVQIKTYISFASMVLEVLILVLVGGSVFAERLSRRVKDAAKVYQQAAMALAEKEHASLSEEVKRLVTKMDNELSRADKAHVWERVRILVALTEQLRALIFKDISVFQQRYLITMYYSSFPGGLYGFIAFGLVVFLMLARVADIYMDSQWLSS